ncbi:MAG: hypothetical protein ABSF98_08775 [Bryobacteraceae bacterium]|jgi:hypothetical protein
MKRVWKALLRLYPPAHQESFAAEMEAVFDQAAEERRGAGWLSFARFLFAELLGMLGGAGAAWTTKSRGAIAIGLPDDATRIQTLIEANLRRMEHAIATHQFEKARFFSYYDLKLREHIGRLEKK